MKIALVHDFLCSIGGSERVFQVLAEEFQEADLYTLAYNPKTTLPFFQTRTIYTTGLNPLIRNANAFRWSFPLATFAMQNLDLSGYDIVLSSSATVAKYVRAKNHLCYCYIPTRALWNTNEYFKKSWKRAIIAPFLRFLRQRDYNVAQKIDHFIAISNVSKRAIQDTYHREADVLMCPIDTDQFRPHGLHRQESYLLVSRLEKWKCVEYAIDAFNQSGKELKVIGSGSEAAFLKQKAKSNIAFLGEVDDATLIKEYNLCRAVIFTPLLEYGLIPLEANACGTPVICYGKGGVCETMLSHDASQNPTAFFFYEQTPAALIEAVERFEQLSFDPNHLIQHAGQWSIPSFKYAMREKVLSKF